MSGGDLSKCCDAENFSILNVNWKCLEYAGYTGSQADLRKKSDDDKLRQARSTPDFSCIMRLTVILP